MTREANQFLTRHVARRRWLYAAGFVSLLVTSVTEVLAPKFAQWTIDTLDSLTRTPGGGDARERLMGLAGLFVVTGLAGFAGRLGWRQTLARATHDAGRMLRMRMWDEISVLPMRFFREGSLGELMSRFSADVNQARMLFGFTLVLWLDCLLFTVFAFGAMFWISWRAGLACLIVLVAVPALVRNLARQEYLQHEKSQHTLASFSDRMAQNLSAIRIQRASGTERFWSEVLENGARLYARDRLRVLKTGLRIFPVTSGASLVCVGAVMVAGWFDLLAGRMGAGGMFALFAYATLLQTPLFELADLVSELQRGRASLDRVLRAAGTVPMESEVARGGLTRGEVDPASGVALRVRDLVIETGNEGAAGVGPVDLELAPGDWLGLSGRIGCGKSLLLSTIAGIHNGARGLIESCEVTLQPQKPFVFSGTVRENLELGTPVDDERLWDALAGVELDAEIRAMDGGLDALLQEGGINLSGGQRQRLTLARALLRESPVMLMDAPLSALDEHTEQKILGNLRARLTGRAVILVSHRSKVLAACDRILDMGDLGVPDESQSRLLHS